MTIVISVVAVGLVVAIAAVLVIREAGRLARRPPPALFDADDAYEWVMEHLPDDVAATLTPDDLRRILEFHLEFLERSARSGNGVEPGVAGPPVVGGGDDISYVLERATATGEAYLPEQVDAVIAAELEYLRAIGAIGPAAEEGGDGSSPLT